MASYGAQVALVSDGRRRRQRGHRVRAPRGAAVAAPILQILPVQLLVDEVAGRRGLTIGELRRHQDDTKVA